MGSAPTKQACATFQFENEFYFQLSPHILISPHRTVVNIYILDERGDSDCVVRDRDTYNSFLFHIHNRQKLKCSVVSRKDEVIRHTFTYRVVRVVCNFHSIVIVCVRRLISVRRS